MTYLATFLIAVAIGAPAPLHRTPAPSFSPTFVTGPATSPPGGAQYHVGDTLVCSDCHVMHASEQHALDGTLTREMWPLPWTGAPNRTLLRAAGPNELCLACHDGQLFAPDVLQADANALTERSAGFLGAAGTIDYHGHNLAASGVQSSLCDRCHSSPMGTATVWCIDCHGPHGNGYFRNLQWASDPGGEPPIRALIQPTATGMARYEAGNVAYPAPAAGDGTFREVTNICIDCHHSFMDDSGGYYTKPGGMTHWGKHPGTNSEWGASRPLDAANANTTPANWVSGAVGFAVPRLKFVVAGAADFTAATAVAANNEVFCLTCHKAHGSEHPFALRWAYSSADANRSQGCLQCHANASGW